MEMKKVEFKKVVIATLVIALCAPFVACSNQHDDRTDLTTRTTESELKPGLSEPNQTINTMSPDQTTESAGTTESSVAQTGKYTYTVYAGTQYETTLSMDINIDDIGMAWVIDKKNGIVFHNGGTGKYNCYLGIDRENGNAVVILSNMAPGYRIPATVMGVKLLNELAAEK
jgi:hypothetical protein